MRKYDNSGEEKRIKKSKEKRDNDYYLWRERKKEEEEKEKGERGLKKTETVRWESISIVQSHERGEEDG